MVDADALRRLGDERIDWRFKGMPADADGMFDLHTGQLAYGVVELNRAPQWSERVIAIPWSAMQLDSEGKYLCVNALRDWIERAPSMQAEAMPNLLDHECAVLIHSFFGTKPYWETGSQQHS